MFVLLSECALLLLSTLTIVPLDGLAGVCARSPNGLNLEADEEEEEDAAAAQQTARVFSGARRLYSGEGEIAEETRVFFRFADRRHRQSSAHRPLAVCRLHRRLETSSPSRPPLARPFACQPAASKPKKAPSPRQSSDAEQRRRRRPSRNKLQCEVRVAGEQSSEWHDDDHQRQLHDDDDAGCTIARSVDFINQSAVACSKLAR